MEIQGLQALYAGHKSVKALAKALQDGSARTIFAEGLCASAAPLLFSSVAAACPQVMACPYVFVLDDAEEAGYFYHDLTQILGEQEVFYSSFFVPPGGEVRAAGRSQRDTPHGGYQPFVGRASSAFRGHLSRGGDGKSRVAAETG